MKTGISDTHPKIQRLLIERYRQMTPQEKLRRVDDLTRTVLELALSRIREQYPNASPREQQLRLGSLWLDRETMMRVFGWDPEKEGY